MGTMFKMVLSVLGEEEVGVNRNWTLDQHPPSPQPSPTSTCGADEEDDAGRDLPGSPVSSFRKQLAVDGDDDDDGSDDDCVQDEGGPIQESIEVAPDLSLPSLEVGTCPSREVSISCAAVSSSPPSASKNDGGETARNNSNGTTTPPVGEEQQQLLKPSSTWEDRIQKEIDAAKRAVASSTMGTLSPAAAASNDNLELVQAESAASGDSCTNYERLVFSALSDPIAKQRLLSYDNSSSNNKQDVLGRGSSFPGTTLTDATAAAAAITARRRCRWSSRVLWHGRAGVSMRRCTTTADSTTTVREYGDDSRKLNLGTNAVTCGRPKQLGADARLERSVLTPAQCATGRCRTGEERTSWAQSTEQHWKL